MPLRKSLIKIIKIFGFGFAILYPFIVFVALNEGVDLRFLALLLLLSAGISFFRNKNIWVFLCVLLLSLCLVVCNNDLFLKLYPVLMNLSVCFIFALSLRGTPLIEKIAKKMGHNLGPKQKEYTRRVTLAWAIFMLCLAIISLITVFLSNEIWVMFNGLISYVLIAIMIGVEFVIRKKVMNVHRDK